MGDELVLPEREVGNPLPRRDLVRLRGERCGHDEHHAAAERAERVLEDAVPVRAVLEHVAQENAVGLRAVRPQVDEAVDGEARAAVDRAIRALPHEAPRVPGACPPVLDRAVAVEPSDRLPVRHVVAVRERRRVAVLPAADDRRGPLRRRLHGAHAQHDGIARVAVVELARAQLLGGEPVQRRRRDEHVALGLDGDLEPRERLLEERLRGERREGPIRVVCGVDADVAGAR